MRIGLSRFLQWRFNIFICRKFGWHFSWLYLKVLGTLYFWLNYSERKKVAGSVESVFAGRHTHSQIRTTTKKVFNGIISHYYEKLFNAYSSAEDLKGFFKRCMESDGLSAIKRGLAKGKGVLLITGHFGGVEFIPGWLAANRLPVTIIVRFSSQQLRETSLQKAGVFGTRIIDADQTPNVLKAVFENLNENRIVVTQCDEIDEWKPSPKDQTTFLGKHIHLDRTLNILSKRGNAAIVFGIMHRLPNERYKMITSSYEEIAHRIQLFKSVSVGEAVLKLLEQYIYQNPEEWYQWKKYVTMPGVPAYSIKKEHTATLPILKPSFGHV